MTDKKYNSKHTMLEHIYQINQRACDKCAQENGHSLSEAEACDEGKVGCPNCPFLDA